MAPRAASSKAGSKAARSSGTITSIASLPPTYGSSTARQPSPAAYGSAPPPCIIGTSTVEPSRRVNGAGAVAPSANGVSQAALR